MAELCGDGRVNDDGLLDFVALDQRPADACAFSLVHAFYRKPLEQQGGVHMAADAGKDLRKIPVQEAVG